MNVPGLSVIIAATESHAHVRDCLAPLGSELRAGRVEAIVVASSDRYRPTPLDVPNVRQLLVPPGRGAADLRWEGLKAARGRRVVFLEDTCVPGPGFVDAWLADGPLDGGAVGTGTVGIKPGSSPLGRALLYFEFGPCVEPAAATVERLAGNNFGADRDVAWQLSATRSAGYEALWLVDQRRNGGRVAWVHGARVDYRPTFTMGRAIVDRVRCGLEFGRLRARRTSSWRRVALLPAAPAIGIIQLLRLGRTVLGKPPHRSAFLRCLPQLTVLVAAWSLGEWFGWLTGSRVGAFAEDMEHRADDQSQPAADASCQGMVVQSGKQATWEAGMGGVRRPQPRRDDAPCAERAPA